MEVIKITRRKIENTQMQENFELSKSKLDTILSNQLSINLHLYIWSE